MFTTLKEDAAAIYSASIHSNSTTYHDMYSVYEQTSFTFYTSKTILSSIYSIRDVFHLLNTLSNMSFYFKRTGLIFPLCCAISYSMIEILLLHSADRNIGLWSSPWFISLHSLYCWGDALLKGKSNVFVFLHNIFIYLFILSLKFKFTALKKSK